MKWFNFSLYLAVGQDETKAGTAKCRFKRLYNVLGMNDQREQAKLAKIRKNLLSK